MTGKHKKKSAKSQSPRELSPSQHIPRYLGTISLNKRRYLSQSTGNLHGLQADDYSRLNWPMPKMFGHEKYAYSLIDIEDERYIEECAKMSKKMIRLTYDQQIIDLEWRKTYKKLLDAEHRKSTLPEDCKTKTTELLTSEVNGAMKYLLELQDQRDMYDSCIQDIWSRCNMIKQTIKKETDLEDLRHEMSQRTKDRIEQEDAFWKTKFNTRSPKSRRPSRDWLRNLE